HQEREDADARAGRRRRHRVPPSAVVRVLAGAPAPRGEDGARRVRGRRARQRAARESPRRDAADLGVVRAGVEGGEPDYWSCGSRIAVGSPGPAFTLTTLLWRAITLPDFFSVTWTL